MDLSNWHIESVCRFGKNRAERPILVRFTSFKKDLEVLHAKRNLAGVRIRLGEDYSTKVWEKHRQLIQYMKDPKNQWNQVYLQKDKLLIKGKNVQFGLSERKLAITSQQKKAG